MLLFQLLGFTLSIPPLDIETLLLALAKVEVHHWKCKIILVRMGGVSSKTTKQLQRLP